MPISAVDCVQPALQHTREQLFRPFRLGQWSRLALVGILAAEMRAGGCNSNLGRFMHGPKTSQPNLPWHLPLDLPSLNSHISEHFAQIVGLIVAAVFALMLLAFVFLYINSVFRFILFDSVLRRHCSIGEGWRRWHRAGARFFLWQIVFQIFASLFLMFLIGVPVALALAAGWGTDLREHVGRLIIGVVLLVGVFVLFLLTAIVVQVLARDFLVPIMALEDLDFADGWHRLLGMVRLETGKYVVYLLLKLVLAIAAAILFGILALVPALFVVVPSVAAVLAARAAGLGWSVTTISLAIILGTLLLLLLIYLVALVCVPATVFFPAFSIYFFASRYPKLDALLNPAPPASVSPPLSESPPPFEAPPLPPSPEPI